MTKMTVRDELEQFTKTRPAVAIGTQGERIHAPGRLFTTIGVPGTKAVRREYVLQIPGSRIGVRPRSSRDVLAELELYTQAPAGRVPVVRNGMRGYAYSAGEFFGGLFRKEPKTPDEARRQVADLRIAVERAREEIARASTRIATEEKKIIEAERKIREAEEKVVRLQRAFELEGVNRRRAAAALTM